MSRREMVIVGVILVGMFFALDLHTVSGRKIPVEPPAEERRVHSTRGFSIIVPPDWTESHSDGSIASFPNSSIAARARAMIVVAVMNENTAPTVAAKFQDQSARLQFTQRPWMLDHPAWATWTYTTIHDGKPYFITYAVNEERDEIPPMALRYLETFRVEPPVGDPE